MVVPASNGKTVLITGINGYISSVLGLHLLAKGYSVRGTTRRRTSSEPLLIGPYASYKERVEIYEVPDITVSGAFDKAARGVHGIFHTASPIDFTLTSYEDFIPPAVRGTETIFESALKAGPQLSSVVITSSVAAISNPAEPGYVFTEKDFAHAALDKAIKDKAEGIKTPASLLYAASKVAAEREVWKFKNEKKPLFAISTINPGVVYGPPVVLPASASQLNETLKPVYQILSGASALPTQIGTGSFVDVRDIATLHIWACEHPEIANGERYIAAAGCGAPQAIADFLHYKYKGTKVAENIVVANPGRGYIGYNKDTGEVANVKYPPESPHPSGKKAEEVTGIKWIPFEQSIGETAEALEPLL